MQDTGYLMLGLSISDCGMRILECGKQDFNGVVECLSIGVRNDLGLKKQKHHSGIQDRQPIK